jgi:sugar/nucleoside kinase (ribokinase family)
MTRKTGKKPPGKAAAPAAAGRAGARGKGRVPARPGRAGEMAAAGRAGETARSGNVLVLGSVALDSVKTPFGEVSEVLGGSAAFFATAASYFTAVSVIAVVGEDFPERHLNFLRQRDIDLSGLERRPGKTFRWRGEYSYQLNEAKTLDTQLNVFETFRPQVPASHQSPDMLFLANIDPDLQRGVLEQVKRPRLVACDTMNFWIEGKRDALFRLLKEVDVLVINDGEARALGQNANLVAVARTILGAGPKTLIIKRGEYGVLMFTGDRVFAVPAFPLEEVKDPTGAGDCFAGGFMGYLARTGKLSEDALRRAVVYGSVMASFAVEAFSLDRLRGLEYKDIEARFGAFKQMTVFEELE